jgi:Tol biopolymer transport system component
VYRPGGRGGGNSLTWLDRKGNTVGMPTEAIYDSITLRLSPDGSKAAVQRWDTGPTVGGPGTIWLLDLVRGGRTRFTFTQSGSDNYAAWSPDGAWIAFSSKRGDHFDLYRHAANGAGEDELLLKSDTDKFVKDWSRDNRFLLFDQIAPKNSRDLWVLPMDSADRTLIPFLRSEFNARTGRFSPDGRWIAYQSVESGQAEIYVRPFPAPPGGGGQQMISQGGGYEPRWGKDGKELFYLSADAQLMAAEVTAAGSVFQLTSTPKALFKAAGVQGWDVNADGTRFLFPSVGARSGETASEPFTVVLNWTALLKR